MKLGRQANATLIIAFKLARSRPGISECNLKIFETVGSNEPSTLMLK